MHHTFDDITDKMGEPKWYDIHGFPRYCDFQPGKVWNIYADMVIYYRIGCQACRKKFMVAESSSIHNIWQWELFKTYLKEKEVGSREPLSQHVVPFFKTLTPDQLANFIHYGDPPRHDCVGDTMNCDDLKIVEFWTNPNMAGWRRVKELEIELPDSL